MTDQRSTLNRRQRTNPKPEMTIDQVAKELGITPCRVQQLERAALIKLRRRLHALGYERDDLLD